MRDEEGEPADSQILWGLAMDFRRFKATLPGPKAMQMRYLLAEPKLQFGFEKVRLRMVRELSGLGQFCANAEPALKRELPVIH